MYRSRMPYIRWHAKGELLKERIKESMASRYYRLRQQLSNSEESATSDNEKDTGGLRSTQGQKTERSASDDTRYTEDNEPRECMTMVKGLRQQQKEYEKANKLLGFGIQCERFKKDTKKMQAPPPGTYNLKWSSFSVAPKSQSRNEEPFTKASKGSSVLTKSVSSIGPGVYDTQSVLNRSTVLESKGRFDINGEVRCGPIKCGYLATIAASQHGPRFTDFPTFVDLLSSRDNLRKGKFLLSERFPRKKALQLGPTTYDPVYPYEKPTSFNVKQVPFLRSAARMTDKQYQQFIGNFPNPFKRTQYHLSVIVPRLYQMNTPEQ
ncbi:hypothetical protein PHET_06002 [Paragonimus heterotremus]|uniref:Uncharacterized protein n=1 Tax=Paragonimus heterotremus TaxID=100268 RepID=A0A8J4TAH8_9TREM|nr:hypothetical protein PHET_06002 [Paragonimus heterotremus]